MRPGAPLRFLGMALLAWVGLRVGVHAPGWLSAPEQAIADPGVTEVAAFPPPARSALPITPASATPPTAVATMRRVSRPLLSAPAWRLPLAQSVPVELRDPAYSGMAPAMPTVATMMQEPSFVPQGSFLARTVTSRWSGSAWLLLRQEAGGPTLAPGGTLGGSQAGARILYRLNRDSARPLALSARAYLPLRRVEAAEVALGLDWQPAAGVPLRVLAERRQAIGREGRSAFALTLHGGHSAQVAGLRIDAYGQAGIVGLRSRDLFADGAVRVAVPVGPIEIGGGLWGAAQPGAARLDAGPQLALPLRAGRANFRLAAEYRLRVAGGAAPGSGPVLTFGAGF